MKVTETIANDSKTATRIDLELDTVPASVREDVKKKVGEFLFEQVLLSVGAAKSPVDGEGWPALSAAYKKEKEKEGGSGKADLELTGDMLNAFDYKPTKDGIELGIYGKDAPKADGHNNFSGDSPLAAIGKQRRFLPDVGQEFRASIQDEVGKIIADAVASVVKIDKQDLSHVGSSAELYEMLSEYFDGMSKSEMKDAVLTNPELADLLDSEDLLGYL